MTFQQKSKNHMSIKPQSEKIENIYLHFLASPLGRRTGDFGEVERQGFGDRRMYLPGTVPPAMVKVVMGMAMGRPREEVGEMMVA